MNIDYERAEQLVKLYEMLNNKNQTEESIT
jgi:hypothetical protein